MNPFPLVFLLSVLTSPSAHDRALQFETDGYSYGVAPNSIVVTGVLLNLDTGDVLVPGDPTPAAGIYWSVGGDDVLIDTLKDCGEVSFGSNTIIEFGQPAVSFGDISVECGAGFYSCCFCNQNGCPVARCRRNNIQNDSDCQSGGAGSKSCSISQRACP